MSHPKNKLIYLRPAKDDILDIARYYIENVGVNSARKITNEIEETINSLKLFTLMGSAHPDSILGANGYRKLIVSSPYICIYKLINDEIYIYRIVNAKIDYPKLLYWYINCC